MTSWLTWASRFMYSMHDMNRRIQSGPLRQLAGLRAGGELWAVLSMSPGTWGSPLWFDRFSAIPSGSLRSFKSSVGALQDASVLLFISGSAVDPQTSVVSHSQMQSLFHGHYQTFSICPAYSFLSTWTMNFEWSDALLSALKSQYPLKLSFFTQLFDVHTVHN